MLIFAIINKKFRISEVIKLSLRQIILSSVITPEMF